MLKEHNHQISISLRGETHWARAFNCSRMAEAGSSWHKSQERGYLEEAAARTFLPKRKPRDGYAMPRM